MEKQGLKLDFRFADEMDAVELVQFVNEAHDEEVTEGSGMAFRKAGQRVTVEEIEADLVSMPVKWLVLETPVPEEAIVGAARLKHDSSRNGHVDCFCVSSPCSEEAKIAVMKRLLSKVETVCYNLGLRSCILEAPQWRTDLEALFSHCGYEERSGHIWPEDRQDQLLKPTMVLEYHKVFPVQGARQSQQAELQTRSNDAGMYTSDTEAGRGGGLDLGELSIVGEEVEVQAPGAAAGSMPQLLNNLFAALHAEYGSGGNSGGSVGEE